MKIIIYTITECPFSKQEKEYLSAHGLPFEEKNLETNREFLTEMLAVGSNFAGTPVTKIEKDDGQIVALKGFTPAEFDKTLGFSVESGKPVETTQNQPEQTQQVTVGPTEPQQAVPATEVAPALETVAPVQALTPEPVAPAPQPEVPQVPAALEDLAMNSVLNNLEQQAQAQTPVASPTPEVPQAPAVPATGTPVIPDPQF